ncbi:MAG: 30S ribosomal protein S7 [Parcubacteria group bacterium QH_9_35_7]|nr:MAG: 30S ribosomal protein S7 [Parcubacteria group bacterium QH_9_35_7]
MSEPLEAGEVKSDPKYDSEKLAKFINYVMQGGKKQLARKTVYKAIENLAEGEDKEPLELWQQAVENVAPHMEVRSRRVGGANYNIPITVAGDRRYALAYRWIINAAKDRSEENMVKRLTGELSSALQEEGAAIKRRDEVHRMAEANKAFAHFAKFIKT